ncbi:MAG: isocitrate lyase/phosphoenolpyruvate mutase family protein [Chloroflexota bacterium]|nr:isocitrate lyase/phosphoenolpyruvate mutase family protein [Chloroflexota bacterium]MDE3192592.1 isocitrate lyase/phosphoenolpyruvate mutase family protein [Chloroflexota bacterium]
MESAEQRAKAEAFRALHAGPRILVLPNAWDAASARVFEEAGFPAIATTSGGVAAVFGYPDGERVPLADVLRIVERIAAVVRVPVTADMEACGAPSAERVAETVRRTIAAGAVGINLEDSTHAGERALTDVGRQVELLQEARRATGAAGVPIVINARTDVYLRGSGEAGERFDEAVRRANAYRRAGADCLFLIGVRDGLTIERLVRAIDGPVNVVGGPGALPVPELERLGVRRVSIASGASRASLALVERIATELRATGTYGAMEQKTMTHAKVNALFER